MATLKRKRVPARSKPSKRSKYAESSDHAPESSSPVSEQEWAAEGILNERIRNNQIQYLIQWAGVDPKTGEAYPPTWEPKANANAILLASWTAQKARRETLEEARSADSNGQIDTWIAQSESTRPVQKARKLPKRAPILHIGSSPEPASEPSRVSTPGVVSSTATTPLAEPLTKPLSPRIQIGRRGSSLERRDFDFFSQVAHLRSQAQSQSLTQVTDLDSSQLFAAVPENRLADIVFDSQSSAGEASFVLPTQGTTETTQETVKTNGSQDVTEDSGLLEIIEEAACAPSPARSIPETIYNTSAESQSQSRRELEQEPIEIPETLEIVLSSSQAAEENSNQQTPSLGVANNSRSSVTQGGAGEVVRTSDVPSRCQDSRQKAGLADHNVQLQAIHPPSLQHQSHNSSLTISSPDSSVPRAIVRKTFIKRRDFAADTQPSCSTAHSTESRQQQAQVVPTEAVFSSQEELDELIPPSCESNKVSAASGEKQRDASQESQEQQLHCADNSSLISHPPSHSPAIFASNLHPRPTRRVSVSNSIMASNTGEELARRMREEIARRKAASPFSPSNLARTLQPSPTTALDGTRSPSSVPDRPPAPPAPTSLRTVALSQSSQAPAEETRQQKVNTSNPEQDLPEPAIEQATNVTTDPAVPAVESSSDDDERLDDAEDGDDDDDSSLLNDDLSLGYEEYVVPIIIELRQSDSYTAEIAQRKEVLESFLQDPNNRESLAAVEEVLYKLRAIETHYDLIYAEANSPLEKSMQTTQAEHEAQWGVETSAKFKFLDFLFTALKDQTLHLVLLIENDNDKLFNIIDTFCFAKRLRYNMPTKDRGSRSDHAEGKLQVSIFQSSASPVIQPVDIIICLDGVQHASEIRRKAWASNAESVPVLHLIVPRTVGHIERYLSTSLNKTEKIHTTLASLAQMRGQLGMPLEKDTAQPEKAAEQVAEWVQKKSGNRAMWPLGKIGSVKNIIEYQTQISQDVSPPPERSKRPHDDEELDSAKRMRLTPQPNEATTGSSLHNTHDVTHISDSMPLTSNSNNLEQARAQAAHWEAAYHKERAARQADKALFREHEIQWDKQQTVHEDFTREYRLLQGKQKDTEKQLDNMRKTIETLRNRLTNRENDLQTLRDQLRELTAVNTTSADEKVVEITKLRKELADAKEEKERAIRNAKAAEDRAEYTKEQYRVAQEAAAASQAALKDIEAQNEKLQQQASARPAKLKALHLNNQFENQATQIRSLRAETNILKKSLAQKEDELQRAKASGGRMGVGTRGTSATPQPKTRSRAASPMGGRLSNLRNG